MKILQINIFGNLSTGKIAVDLYKTLAESGNEGIICYARNLIETGILSYRIGNNINFYFDVMMARITDKAGHFSRLVTKNLIGKVDKYKPDVIHLHNIHGYYINVPLLFDYLKKSDVPVVWTLYDCWSYTGHCCYYSMACCDKWKTGCYRCPQKSSYPKSIVDRSEENYREKREMFNSVPKLQLVTVSKWLENEVNRSFLQNIPQTTIYNGIDTEVFRPRENNFRKEYKLEDKIIILGVASTWDKRKELQDLIELSKLLDSKYKIVLVGLTAKEINYLPYNILGITRTDTAVRLTEIYSSADVFFNASVEESFGLPTIEAISCGTPVVVYNTTASPEVVSDSNGVVVKPHDMLEVRENIEKMLEMNFKPELDKEKFDKNNGYKKYINLYKTLIFLGEGYRLRLYELLKVYSYIASMAMEAAWI